MISLLELYHPALLELTGKRLDLKKMPGEVQAQWDEFSRENGIDRVEFIERNGKIYAADLTDKSIWYEWGADGWKATGKMDVKRGREPGRYQTQDWGLGQWVPDPNGYGGQMQYPAGPQSDSCYDKFSKDPVSYRNNITRAADKIFGKDWRDTIDSVYGTGSVDKIFADLWKNFWTDHEGLGEVGHYFDAARQANEKDGTPNYNLHIGPRFDIPDEIYGDDTDPNFDPLDPANGYTRRTRVTNSEYFDNIAGHA